MCNFCNSCSPMFWTLGTNGLLNSYVGYLHYSVHKKSEKSAKFAIKKLCTHTRVKRKKNYARSRTTELLRPVQRYNCFQLIRITCQTFCHGKTELVIFVKFKNPSKTSVVPFAGVTISGTPFHRHITIWCRSTFRPRDFTLYITTK